MVNTVLLVYSNFVAKVPKRSPALPAMESSEATSAHLQKAVLFIWPALPWVMVAAVLAGLFFVYLERRAFTNAKRQSHRPGRRRRMVWH